MQRTERQYTGEDARREVKIDTQRKNEKDLKGKSTEDLGVVYGKVKEKACRERRDRRKMWKGYPY